MKTRLFAAGIVLPASHHSGYSQPEGNLSGAESTSDTAAIRALSTEFDRALTAGEEDRFMQLLADHVMWLVPNHPALVGKEAVHARIRQRLTESKLDLVTTPEEVQVAGNWAFVRGTYTMRITTTRSGASEQENGKVINILERQSDGGWKVTRHIWNADHPDDAPASGIQPNAARSNTIASAAPSAAEEAAVRKAAEARVDEYIEAARRRDIDWFLNFWADVDGVVLAGDGKLLDRPAWVQELRKALADTREFLEFTFHNRHTYVLARDAAVHTTQFRWAVLQTSGKTLRMHGSWSYVFKNIDGVWKVVHSAGTHIPE